MATAEITVVNQQLPLVVHDGSLTQPLKVLAHWPDQLYYNQYEFWIVMSRQHYSLLLQGKKVVNK